MMPNPSSRHLALATSLVLVAAFYQPISFWAANAWDLSSPAKLLTVGTVVALLGLGSLALLRRLGTTPLLAGLTVGGIIMLLYKWHDFPGNVGPLLVAVVIVLAWLGARRASVSIVFWLAVWFVAAFGLVPLVQLGVAHARDSTAYPLLPLPVAQPSSSSGLVEDLVVVIVDSYPNVLVSQAWFDHGAEELLDILASYNFTVQENAWSRHTFTGLSVSGILELQSVIAAGPTQPWGNRSSLWQILRGDNFVSETLGLAGYTYTHIESGWEGSTCGPEVDRCIASPWIDEQVWRLLDETIARDWLFDRSYSYTGTMNTAHALRDELLQLTSNESHDYLFAHLLMPHEPALVDGGCQLRKGAGRWLELEERRAAISMQMSCVDSLLADILDMVDHDTAVLITGDHGSGTGGQVGQPPDHWSDADIAERFSVFLAYRLPTECGSPRAPDPMVVMNSALTCAVDAEFTTPPAEYIIGDQDPEAVTTARMETIKTGLASGSIGPDPE